VLQVDADARPGLEPPAHRIDQHVGGLEVRSGVRVSRFPALEAGERIFLRAGPADLEQRLGAGASAGRLR